MSVSYIPESVKLHLWGKAFELMAPINRDLAKDSGSH